MLTYEISKPKTKNLNINNFKSIKDVPQKEWDSLISMDSVGLERNHLLSIENSMSNNLIPFYTMIYDNSKLIGIGYYFIMDIDFSSLGKDTPKYFSDMLESLDTEQNFKKQRVMECGIISGLGETIIIDDTIVWEKIAIV